MTQKRILRATERQVKRERDARFRDAFRLYAADAGDPAVTELVTGLAEESPGGTSVELFEMAAWLVDELAQTTGETHDEVLARLHRG